MDDDRPIDWLPGSAHRPDWRLLRASHRLQTGEASDSRIDDKWVEIALHLLKSLDGPEKTVKSSARAAYELWRANDVPRWILEARLLTTEPITEVAAASSVPEAVVEAYLKLFFDVRACLGACDWVLLKAVRSHPMNGFAGPQPGGLWRFFAFTAGPVVLDVIVAATLNSPMPVGLCASISEEELLRLKAKLTIAAMTAKVGKELSSVVRMRVQLRKLEKKAGLTVSEKESLLELKSRFLALLSRPARIKHLGRDSSSRAGRARSESLTTTGTHLVRDQQLRRP